MPEERFNKIVNVCRDAYSNNHINFNFLFIEMQHDGELKYFKDMACHIKKQIEEQEKGTSGWHVIVGKITFCHLNRLGTNFGSFVTFESTNIVLFWLEHIGFLLFKHG